MDKIYDCQLLGTEQITVIRNGEVSINTASIYMFREYYTTYESIDIKYAVIYNSLRDKHLILEEFGDYYVETSWIPTKLMNLLLTI